MNFAASIAACIGVGMNFFAIETAEDYNQLMAYKSTTYGAGGTFKVNGKKATNGSWFLNLGTENVKPLYSAAVPTNITGSCLVFTGSLPYITLGVNCSSFSTTFCEFV